MPLQMHAASLLLCVRASFPPPPLLCLLQEFARFLSHLPSLPPKLAFRHSARGIIPCSTQMHKTL